MIGARSTRALVPAALAMIVLLGLLAALAWGPLRRETRLRRRLEDVRELHAPIAGVDAGAGPMSPGARIVAGVGFVLTRSGILSAKAIANLQSTLASASLRGAHALPIFVGAKAMLLAGLPL
ncbi:MAG: hypothetical protein ABI369_14425, partial [Acetobacteraceae bacterium]